MKNAINYYRLAVAMLIVVLLMVLVQAWPTLPGPALRSARQRADIAEAQTEWLNSSLQEAKARASMAEDELYRTKIRLDAMERGVIITPATRKAIAAEVKAGGSVKGR